MTKYTENLNRSLLFRVDRNSLLQKLCEAFDGGVSAAEALNCLLARACQKGWTGNLWHCCLAEALLMSENPYTLAFERRDTADCSLRTLALKDMELWKELFDAECEHPAWTELSSFTGDGSVSEDTPVTDLAENLAACGSAEEMLQALQDNLKRSGCGIYALATRFRVDVKESGFELLPLEGGRRFGLSELVGYAAQKKQLVDNTESFLSGKGSNNVLLYGDAGTGKSTCVQALATEYGDRGLRIVEIHKHQFQVIPDLISRLANRRYRFIFLLDDLSFEENETQYKYLKAVMEGGAQAAPENIRIYATSNRRHLVRENWSDRSDMEHDGDIHRSDTMEEKLSLSSRFGLQIFYPSPDFDEYQNIVSELAARYGVQLSPEELKKQAATWQVRHGSRSGRIAKQFIDSL